MSEDLSHNKLVFPRDTTRMVIGCAQKDVYVLPHNEIYDQISS